MAKDLFRSAGTSPQRVDFVSPEEGLGAAYLGREICPTAHAAHAAHVTAATEEMLVKQWG